MWIRQKEEEAQSLHTEALERLAQGDLDGCEVLATRLETLGWAGAFEVRALARRKRGDLEGAIDALEAGIQAVPGMWLFHQLRGNMLDEAGRIDEALASYDAALGCEGVSVSSVRYNRAITRLRTGDAGGALADAEHVITEAPDAPFAGHAVHVAVDALAALGRAEDAIALVDHVIAAARGEASMPAVASLQAPRAKAMRKAGWPLDAVRAAVHGAHEAGVAGREIAELLLETTVASSAPRRAFRVVLEVDLRAPALRHAAPPEAAGYYRVLRVIADDDASARAIAVTLEPSVLRGHARVHEIVDEGPSEGPPHVMPTSGRIYFGAEE